MGSLFRQDDLNYSLCNAVTLVIGVPCIKGISVYHQKWSLSFLFRNSALLANSQKVEHAGRVKTYLKNTGAIERDFALIPFWRVSPRLIVCRPF